MAARAGDGAGAAAPPQRHYPLDTHLPFDRYEHRLTARDVMAYRIMNKFMRPSPSLRDAYEEYVRYPGGFEPISPARRENADLRADLNTLDKMLTTRFLKAPPAAKVPLMGVFPSDHAECCGILTTIMQIQGPRPEPARIKEQVVDLLTRHYFERDNAAFRAWITRLSSFPYPGTVAPRHFGFRLQNHRSHFPPRFDFLVKCPANDWTDHETEHLRKLRSQVALQNQLPLYDGGTFMAQLRRQMDGKAFNGSRRGLKNSRWNTRSRDEKIGATISWPGEEGVARFFICSHWQDHSYDTALLDRYPSHKLDVSTNGYRGRNRDGIWSTGQAASWGKRNAEVGRYGRPRRRCTSEPPPGAFTHAFLGALEKSAEYKLIVTFPAMTLSEIDRRSRRRSLSRTRVQEMFDWDIDLAAISDPTSKAQPKPDLPAHCENCGQRAHRTVDCTAPCGHCGAPNPSHRYDHFGLVAAPDNNEDSHGRMYMAPHDRHREPHLAPQCPVARHNRCKCLPFPFHIADRCGVPCHRNCGKLTEAAPGSYQHRNAMLCRARCCMCGIKGHSGKECHLKRCRCGGAHLGQDCSWKPECRVLGCGRYWCGVHCRNCGGTEKPFVKWRCTKCAGGEAKDTPEEEVRGRRRRRRRRNGDEKDAVTKEDIRCEANATANKTNSSTRLVPPSAIAPPPQAGKEPFISIFGGPRAPRDVAARRTDGDGRIR